MKRSKNSKAVMLACGVFIAAISMTQVLGQPRVNSKRLKLSTQKALIVPFLGNLSMTIATIQFSQLLMNQ